MFSDTEIYKRDASDVLLSSQTEGLWLANLIGADA